MGSVVMLASFGGWAWLLAQRAAGIAPALVLAPVWLHADLMLFGFLPLFMLGFINTAGPKWLGVTAPPRWQWAGSTLTYAGGSVLIAAAQIAAPLHAFGDALHVLGWVWAVAIWIGRIRLSQASDQRHARMVLLAFCCGLLALVLQWAASSAASVTTAAWLTQAVVSVGVWGFFCCRCF